MASNANLNIKINPQINIDEIKKSLASISGLDLDLGIDTNQFEQAIENALEQYDSLEQALSDGVNIKVNDTATPKVKKLMDSLTNIQASMDLSDIEAELDKFSEKELAELNKAIDEAFEFDSSGAGNNIKKLAQEFDKAQTETKQLVDEQKKALAQMKLTGQGGSESFKKLAQEIDASEKQLKEMEKAAGQASKQLSFGDKMAKFGLVADGIDAIGNSVKDMSQPFVELDTATNRIKTLGGEAKKLAPDFREMSLEMSKKYPIGAAALQTATYDALSAGIKATKGDIEAFMTASTKLAVGGGEEVGNTVNLLSSLVNSYGESAAKSGEYSDILFTTVNLGKTNVQELSASLSQVIPTAAEYGLSLKGVGASLALMTANGIPTAQATTKLNALLIEMQKPGAELEKIMNKAGVSVESLGAKVKSGDVVGALKDLDGAFKKSGLSATQAFSSNESGAAFNTLTKDFGKLQETMSAFDNSAGSTEAAYQDMSNSIENRSKLMKSQVETAFIGILDSSGAFGEVAVAGGQMFAQLSPMITGLSGFKVLFGDMGKGALDFVNKIITTLIPSLVAQTAATGAATTTQTGLNAAMMANPAGAIVIAIAAIVAALYLFMTKTEAGRQMFESFKQGLSSIWTAVEPAFNALINVGGEILGFLGNLGEFLYEFMIFPFEMGAKVISSVINWFLNFIGVGSGTASVVDMLKNAFAYAGKAISSMSDALGWIIDKFKIAKTIIGNFITSVPEMFGLLFEYAKYYLNPVNWVDGDDKYEAVLSKKFGNLINKITDTSKAMATKSGQVTVAQAQQTQTQIDQVNNKAVESEGKKTKASEKTNKAKKTAIELANEEYNANKKLLDQKLQQYEIDAERVRIAQKRNSNEYDELALQDKKLKNIQSQQEAYLKAYKSLVTLNDAGELVFSAKIKDADKAKITEDWGNLTNNLQDGQNKRESIKIKIGINADKFQQELDNFNKENLKMMVELGLAFPQEILMQAEKELANKTQELNDLLKKRDDLKLKMLISPSTDDQAVLEEMNQSVLKLQNEQLSLQKNYNSEKKSLAEKTYKSLESINEKENKSLEEKQKKEAEAYQHLYDIINETSTQALEAQKDQRLDGLDSQMNAEIARVGDNENAKAAITEKYNKLKYKAEEEFASKTLVLQSRMAGEQSAFNDAQALESMEKKKAQYEAELKIAQEAGDVEKVTMLNEQIDGLSSQISEKGDVLNNAMAMLGQGANDALTNALAGDGDGAKNAMKAKLAELAGYIKKLVSTYVINIVLTSPIFQNLAALAGPFAPVATAGFIGLMNMGINAIVDPLLGQVLSFSRGIAAVDKPTLALIGDAAQQGGDNVESVLRSEHIQGIIGQALDSQESKIGKYIASALINNSRDELITRVNGEWLEIVLQRYKENQNQRTRTIK